MSGDLLNALSAFVQRLADAPHPDTVAADLVELFGPSLGMTNAAILVVRPPLLIVYGLHGYLPDEVEGFESLPIDGDYPATHALHEGEVIVEPFDVVAATYEGTSRPTSRFQKMAKRLGSGYSVATPLMSAGRPVGVLATVCAGEREWTTLDIAAIDAIGSALGMWLTHPDSGLPSDHPRDLPRLTPRQVRILALAADGRTNGSIARTLGYSESTVKQEMHAILRSLGVTTRGAAVARARELGLLEGGHG